MNIWFACCLAVLPVFVACCVAMVGSSRIGALACLQLAGAVTVVVLMLLAVALRRSEYMAVALVFAIASFVGNIGVLRLLEQRRQ